MNNRAQDGWGPLWLGPTQMIGSHTVFPRNHFSTTTAPYPVIKKEENFTSDTAIPCQTQMP